MEIEIYKIANIYNALSGFASVKMPVKVAWDIYKMSSELEDKMKFISNEEKKLIDTYKGTINDDGSIKFTTEEDTKKFADEANKLHMTKIKCDFDKLKLTFDELENCKIEPKIISALSEVIEFVG